MRTITKTLYMFDELPTNEAKEKARAWYRESNDYPFLEDAMHDYLGELLQKYRMKTVEPAHVFYNLGYSQGDGAMFTGDISYKGYTFTVEHYGNYYHYNSKQITAITRNNGNEISDATWSKMFNEFEPLYVEICKLLERYGYDYIEADDSDESVEDNIRANEYEFYETGEIA